MDASIGTISEVEDGSLVPSIVCSIAAAWLEEGDYLIREVFAG